MNGEHGEFRVRDHPDQPGKILITWHPDGTALWIHVAVVDSYHEASDAMADYRDRSET